MTGLIEKIEKNLTETLELPVLTAPMISELLNYQKQLIAIATDTPDVVKKLRIAMNLLEEEQKAKEIGRGGDEITDSFRPDNDIENF